MATYKVIQDIEAEDKILGPLTLKQFIFVIIDAILIFIAIRLFIVSWFLGIPFLPPIIVLGVLAAPIGRDQSTEVWLAAKIRFALKPHKRLWDQSGMIDLVHITVPKKIEHSYTDGFDQQQVRSRLNALASTLDSRGWAVKNISVNLYNQPGYITTGSTQDSDRLVEASTLPQAVPTILVAPEDDIMDADNNPLAKQMDQMIRQQTDANRQRVVNQIKQASNSADYDFIRQTGQDNKIPQNLTTFNSSTVTPHVEVSANPGKPTVEEEALLNQIHTEQQKHDDVSYHSHMKRLKTPRELEEDAKRRVIENAEKDRADSMTKTPNPATLELAKSDDLKVATIAKLANRQKQDEGEVVISLH